MNKKIKVGENYLLDNKVAVRVVKSLNRSNTTFSVKTLEKNILTVESDRLKPVDK